MRQTSTSSRKANEPDVVFGNLRLEPDGTLRRGDSLIHLPPRELAALRFLLEHPGRVVTAEELKAALWGSVHVTDDSVPKCISSLRSRLEPDDCIQTIYKRGYRFSAEVRRCSDAPASSLRRLAILPFAVGPHVADHFGPAIAEEAATRLTMTLNPVVSVVARDSVFTLARQGKFTAQQIGEMLKADLVMTGTLRASTSHFRLRAEMIRIEDGTQIWVEDMLAPKDRVAGLESQVVERLSFRLGVDMSAALSALAADQSDDSGKRDAYENLLQGHQEWQTLERHRMQDGVRHLLRAAELNPALISAKVDLVKACITQGLYGFMSPAVAAEQIRQLADGIANLPKNAKSMLPALGWVSFHVDHDLQSALMMFAACADLPHDPWTTQLRVTFALSRHRFEEAHDLLAEALVEDPFSPWLHAQLAWAYFLGRKPRESIIQIEHALNLFPEHEGTNLYGAIILSQKGEAARGARLSQNLVQRSPYFDIATAVNAYAVACEGDHELARAMMERLQWLSRERFVLRSFNPAVYVTLGDIPGALSELRAANDARCPWFFQMLADPRLEALHGEPEFEQMRTILDEMESDAAQASDYPA